VSETCAAGGTLADLLHKSKRCDQLVSSILIEEVVALTPSIRLYLNSKIHAWSRKPFLSMVFFSCAATEVYLAYEVTACCTPLKVCGTAINLDKTFGTNSNPSSQGADGCD